MNVINIPNPTISFHPKNLKAKSNTVLYARVYWKGQDFKVYTNSKVDPIKWKEHKRKSKKSDFDSLFGKTSIYGDLNTIRNQIINAFELYKAQVINTGNEFVFNEFKSLCRDNLTKDKNVQRGDYRTDLIAFAKHYYAELNGHRAKGTLKTYNTLITQLEAFKETSNKLSFDLKDIDLKFYHEFVSFLYSIPTPTKTPVKANTVGKKVAILKAFLRESHDRGYHNNTAYLKSSFKTPREEVDSVVLSPEQVQTISNLDLKEHPGLSAVRDIFIFNVKCGLRYSDLQTITRDIMIVDSNDNRQLRIKSQKTGKDILLPLIPEAHEIWARYDYKFPHIWPQKFNKKIKTIAKLAELQDNFSVERTSAKNVKTRETRPFCDWICTHTMRRTWATTEYRSGIPLYIISRLLGHSSEKVTRRYLKIDLDQVASDYFSYKKKND
ncbi:MAG: phage integrase SAM-like domain-containing protein [Bacteroidia bacterium]|nr:phage integrase SAM-like domain-containing protein [Bacteroidia bacterium]